MKKTQIKALIFDIGGVLQLPKIPEKIIKDKNLSSVSSVSKHRHYGVHEYISRKLRISVDQWFDSIDTAYAASITNDMAEKHVLSIISKNTKTPRKKIEKLIIRAYQKNFAKNKQLFNLAFKLKKRGYKIAILSDQWHLSKRALMPEKDTKKFDVVVTSCDVGLRKPDPKIFRLTLKKLKLPAKQALFIDNQEWNTRPAKKLKIKTILFKNNKQLFEKLSKKGIK